MEDNLGTTVVTERFRAGLHSEFSFFVVFADFAVCVKY